MSERSGTGPTLWKMRAATPAVESIFRGAEELLAFVSNFARTAAHVPCRSSLADSDDRVDTTRRIRCSPRPANQRARYPSHLDEERVFLLNATQHPARSSRQPDRRGDRCGVRRGSRRRLGSSMSGTSQLSTGRIE